MRPVSTSVPVTTMPPLTLITTRLFAFGPTSNSPP
jgi:hypothetical protein